MDWPKISCASTSSCGKVGEDEKVIEGSVASPVTLTSERRVSRRRCRFHIERRRQIACKGNAAPVGKVQPPTKDGQPSATHCETAGNDGRCRGSPDRDAAAEFRIDAAAADEDSRRRINPQIERDRRLLAGLLRGFRRAAGHARRAGR